MLKISFLKLLFSEILKFWLDLSPYLLLGMLISSVLRLFIREELILRHLGKNRYLDVLKAAFIGVPLPVCSCGVIPIAQSLRKQGASESATLSFLVSTPVTGVDSIMVTYSFLGLLFAVFRPLAAFFAGIFTGGLNVLSGNRSESAAKNEEHCCCCHEENTKVTGNMESFLRHLFIEQPADIGKWLISGVIIGAVISVLVPGDLDSFFKGYPFLDFFVVLFFAIPMYVCATSSIPVAYSLMLKGFSPGAALVFLMAGPATNTVTMSFVYRELGKKTFYIYLAGIAISSIICGAVFNFLWFEMSGSQVTDLCCGENVPGAIRTVSGIILAAMVAATFIRREKQ